MSEPGIEEETWENEGGSPAMDPFGEDAVKQVQLIVQMRLYDVCMAILDELNHEKADALDYAHRLGQVVGALPMIDLSDE